MKMLLAATVVALSMAGAASAATLNGTFTIDIRNFSDIDGDANTVTDVNSAATAANFDAQSSDAVITYTGDINFGIGSGNSDTTTIADFLGSAGGDYTIDVGTEEFLQNTLLSQGTYVTTTFFSITGAFETSVEGTIRHDDGITLVAQDVGGGSFPQPTSDRTTAFSATSGDFTLFYAAANGNPSILQIDATVVPLPAAGFLLLGALGGIAALRRRKTV